MTRSLPVFAHDEAVSLRWILVAMIERLGTGELGRKEEEEEREGMGAETFLRIYYSLV